MLSWTIKKFDELTVHELYAILQLRNEVFAVEQNCVYPDLDDKDQSSYHLMCWQDEKLVAYTRIVPPEIIYKEASIGRVVTSSSVRRRGIGKKLMNRSIRFIEELYRKTPIRIGAQTYLIKFYNELGFETTSAIYIEDGIEHVQMLRP